MATWSSGNIVLTDKGREILSKVQFGIGSITVSKVVTSKERTDSSLTALTAVTSEAQTMTILSKSTDTDGSIINVQVDNTGLATDYYIHQIGVYVTHPDYTGNQLYMIAQCDTESPDFMPLPSETPVAFNYSFYVYHASVASITVTTSTSGTLPLISSLTSGSVFADGDSLAMYDASATSHVKVLLSGLRDFFKTTFDTAYAALSHVHGAITNGGAIGSASGKVITTGTSGVLQAETENTAFNKAFEATATNIKINGTQSVGALSTVARADHVHPTDTSRAAASTTSSHISNISNPHSVTYIQTGAKDYVDDSSIPYLIVAGLYGGTNLVTKFASEISGYANEWAWIKARVQSGNFSGIHINDYIPLTANGTVYNMRIMCTAIGNYIDFISQQAWGDTTLFNPANNNNGNNTSESHQYPWLVSNLYNYCNSLSSGNVIPNSYVNNTTYTSVNHTGGGVYYHLPSAVKGVISARYALLPHRYASGTLVTSNRDYTDGFAESWGNVWIPSYIEVYGQMYTPFNSRVQYPIFKYDLLKLNSWINEPVNGTTSSFFYCSGGGGMALSTPASDLKPFNFCFRIKSSS